MNNAVAIRPAKEISIRQIRKIRFHDCDSSIIAKPLNSGSSPVPDSRYSKPIKPMIFLAFSGYLNQGGLPLMILGRTLTKNTGIKYIRQK